MIARSELDALTGFKVAFERCTGEACCRNTAVAQVSNRRPDARMVGDDDYGIELRCLNCGNHRAWMSDEMIKALVPVLTAYPEMKQDVQIIRGIHLASNPAAAGKANTGSGGRKGKK